MFSRRNRMNTNEKLAEEFAKIHENEWKQAKQSLNHEKHEEEIIYMLMRIIRAIFDHCNDEHKATHQTHISADKIAEEIIEHRLPKYFHHSHITKEVKSFIQRCAHCISRMCSSKYQLTIVWIPKGDMIEKEKFVLEDNMLGNVCDWTVWPAVVDAEGTVLRKGVIIPV